MCDYPLRKGIDAEPLRFDGPDDAITFAQHCVKNVRRWSRTNSLDILKGYVNGDLALVLKVNAPLGAGVFDFVFFVVPYWRFEKLDSSSPGGTGPSNFNAGACATDKHNQTVFTGVTQVIEGKQKVIPSFVTVEASKQRLDFRWSMLAKTPHQIIEIGGSSGAGESCKPSGVFDSRGVHSVVETSAKMLNNLSRDYTPACVKRLSNTDLMNDVRAVRIELGRSYEWVFSEKLTDLGYEVVDMFVCSRETQLCAK